MLNIIKLIKFKKEHTPKYRFNPLSVRLTVNIKL